MDQIEKLRVLIPHWIEHNKGHGTDCQKWAETARKEGEEKIADFIEEAIEAMEKVNVLLEKALEEAGGESSSKHEHHHHHH
jgi:hypothetical protein